MEEKVIREMTCINKAIMKVKTEQRCPHACLFFHCSINSCFNGGKGFGAGCIVESRG
jgi:hypothetical protein